MPPAPDSAAPAAMAQTVDAVIRSHQHLPGALLPILHGIQDALGHVPAQAVPLIATALNLSRAEVHGVVTYYHHFRSAPAGAQVLQVCRAEACQAMGAQALWAHACQRLGLQAAGTSADGAVTLEPVYCLGLCASSPAVALDGQVQGRVGPARLDALLDAAREAPCV